MREGLQGFGLWDRVERVSPRLAGLDLYGRVHSEEYLFDLRQDLESALDHFFVDPDTYVSPGTQQALEALAGSVLYAVDRVSEALVFIAGRPPGHHAGVSGPAFNAPTQGFCLVNTAALLAVLLSERGRVAVLDFDVHHGNGTQEILLGHPDILHVDIHQDYRTIYPWTGAPELRGNGNLYNLNVPPGAGDDIYREALDLAWRLIEDWGADFLVVSAGFDSYSNDNSFSNTRATSSTFNRIGLKASRLRTVVFLEGGYGDGLRRGTPAMVAGLLGEGDPVGDEPTESSGREWDWWRRNLSAAGLKPPA